MSEAVSQTLLWVNEELGNTLSEARQSLEHYIERPENTALLKACADLMHEAAGALMMVEVQGGALLAEEVEHVARRLLDAPADQQTRGEALEALSRAMMQLPSYMERVVNGGRDIPLILLPLLNDLRAVRGEALLSENTLLLMNLPADRRLALQRPEGVGPSGEDVQALARQSRPRFQAALLGWIRGDRPDSSLAVMADVIGALEGASASDRGYQLWWVAAGVIEALRQNGLEGNAAIKRLLGQVDFQLRRLAEQGESAIESEPPVALLNSLLFYVARAGSRGRRVGAIRQCFSLGELVPGQEELESARDSLSAPSVRLMQTVGGAIREDLTRVKDVLDIFVRTGMAQIDELEPQVELLRKIGDTLGVLGLAGLKSVIHEQSLILRAIVDREQAPDEDAMLGVAGRLIEVEDNLERQLVGMITDTPEAAQDTADLEALEARRDFDGVTTTVLRECNVNLGRVKEAIVQSLDAPLEAQVLDEVPQLLRAITAGLLMLERPRAVALVERIGAQIRDWLTIGDGTPADDVLDRLADAIVSLEYFMETIAGGRSDPMYMLDNAEACLAALDDLSRRYSEARAAPPETTGEVAATLIIESPFPPASKAEIVAEPHVELPAAEPARPSVGPAAGAVDPELLELFIEEARELVVTMRQRLPEWAAAPEGEAPLAELRRLFHTLKGSGRMVGAERIGEYAWRVENMLNRVIGGTVEPVEGLIAFVGEAVEQVPGLIEQLETGQAPAGDVDALMKRADAWAEGRAETAAAEAPEPAPVADDMDPVLRGIFAKEAGEHLGTIRAYLADCAERAAPYAITEDLYRACHTLAGSANMAGVEPAVTLARPLDRLVRSLHDDGARISGDVLALCASAAERIARIVDAVRDGHRPEVEVEGLAAALRHEQEEHALRVDAATDGTLIDAAPDFVVAEDAATPAEAGASDIEIEPQPADEIAEPVAEAPVAAPAEERVDEPVESVEATAAEEPPAALDIDPEIAAIFREEADEILERCDEVLHVWRERPGAREPLDEFQRQLHTLKGGARLAGMTAMGDLSHALEDRVTCLLREPSDHPYHADLIQRGVDELHRMRDGIDQGVAVPFSPALAAELDGGAPPAEVPAIEAPAEQPDEMVAEAEPEFGPEPGDALEPPFKVDFPLVAEMPDEPELVAGPESGLAEDLREPVEVDFPLGEETPDELELEPRADSRPAPDEDVPTPVEVDFDLGADAAGEADAEEGVAARGDVEDAPSIEETRVVDEPPVLEEAEAGFDETLVLGGLPATDETPVDAGASTAEEAADLDFDLTDASETPAEPVVLGAEEAVAGPLDFTLEEPDEAATEPAAEAEPEAEVSPDWLSAENALPEAVYGESLGPEETRPGEDEPPAFGETVVHRPSDEPEARDEEVEAPAFDETVAELPPLEPPAVAASEEEPAFDETVVEPAFDDAGPGEGVAAESEEDMPAPTEEPAPVARAPIRPAPPIEIPAAAAPGMTPAVPDIAAASPAIGARSEIARVDADLLERLLNNAGEVSIYRSRLEQQVGSIEFNLEELSQTVIRLREQLRKLEMETDVQVLHGQPAVTRDRDGFDSLEMDRYSMVQQLSRALAETASDVSSLQHLLGDLARDAGTLLTQQQRVISELQDGLMRTRMVPFSRHVQRLNRIVRQAAREAGKQAELQVVGAENELDRQVMDRMLGPFEHLLRNAIVHGIEAPDLRESRGKPATGRVGIELRRDGAEMRVVVSDDGAGLDFDAIREKAAAHGFVEDGVALDDEAASEMIFRPGFSTAIELTLTAGRGVGMDVVANEIRELGGSLRVESDPGEGVRFVIRLPYTRAITQALVLRAGEEMFALPLPTVEGIARVRACDLGRLMGDDAESFEYGGHSYKVRHIASLVNGQSRPLPADDSYVPLVLVRAGEHSTALLSDEMLGAREIVVKTLGPQFSGVCGVAGATILGDGSIVIILDVGALVRTPDAVVEEAVAQAEEEARDGRTFVMVVDDSITVRRVTERLLERNGMRVVTAKDGVDAVSMLREHRPDIILLDIEMPRMDGYEVAHHIRNDPRLRDIPIVMITSRVGHKHRARAMDSGVDDYLGKPYQENQLLAAIGALVDDRQVAGGP